MTYIPKCDNCGELTHALIDGYNIRDRELEGVMLEVHFKNGNAVSANCLPEDEEYMDDFNTKKIYKEACEFAQEQDILTCPKCNNDIDGPDGPIDYGDDD